jgi:TonB-dependent receptor
MQYAFFNSNWWVRQLNFDVGRVASFGPDFTQGAAGAGFVQTVYDATDKHGTTYMPSIRYRHNGPLWDWQVGGAFSRASNYYRDIDKGYFQNSSAFFRNVTIRFEDMGYEAPRVVDVRDAQGNAVNPYDLSNYRLESVNGRWLSSSDIVRTAYFNAKRDLGLRVPLTVKTGVDFRSQTRDIRRPTAAWSFTGEDGVIRTADDNADQWYDPVYSQKDLLYGPRMEWMNLGEIGDTYYQNSNYFLQTQAQEVDAYRSGVTGSQAITETIWAPYVRLDAKLFASRLHLAGGVRYEHTEDDGVGPLIDPTAIYQRDASGNIVRNSSGQPVVIAPLNTVAGSQLAYVERGSGTKTSYDGYFPSLNASYMIRENLIARVSYGRSINRPDFGNILPSMNLPDTEGTSRTISLTNPDLKPWIADSFGLALEYYFDEPATGFVSARAYRREISDFWGAVTVPASDEVLEPWGIDPALYGEALGYVVSTRRNVGDARVSGLELDYRQNLTFLPKWARGVTLFGNITWQDLEGSEQASFSGFAKKIANWGISFNRQRFAVRLAVNHRGLIRQNLITNAGTEAGTYQYLLPRTSADFTAEYRVTRHFALYVSGRNINEEVDYTVRYGPSTPRDRIVTGRAGYGATWYVGIKGTF